MKGEEMKVPHIGDRTIAFATTIQQLATDGQVTVTDDELIAAASELVGYQWKVPHQALIDALTVLEKHGAIEFDRRKRGRKPHEPVEEGPRLITLQPHWLWDLLTIRQAVPL